MLHRRLCRNVTMLQQRCPPLMRGLMEAGVRAPVPSATQNCKTVAAPPHYFDCVAAVLWTVLQQYSSQCCSSALDIEAWIAEDQIACEHCPIAPCTRRTSVCMYHVLTFFGLGMLPVAMTMVTNVYVGESASPGIASASQGLGICTRA